MHFQIVLVFIIAWIEEISSSFIQPAFPFNLTFGGDCSCAFAIEPVCALKGNVEYTYINECVLQCAIQLNKKPTQLLYKGTCCRAATCTQFDAPVCDMNGDMYSSTCEFELSQCIAHRLHGTHIGLDTQAPKCQCVRQCGREWEPVCDTNGKTHANLCTFLNYRCFHKMQLKENIEIDYLGTCCDDMCIATHHHSQIFCDSEGSTHRDLCSFYKAQCRLERRTNGERKLKISRIGRCPDGENEKTNALEKLLKSILFSNEL
ncbi:unnamed protein product, partial [Mesorhabditis belari]|uniref:Kazal-like domain-containing protein n=1 Tax=Mesorhabditis belari TaxID=2138241 RepID=A0AAF3ESI4_9BILA